MSSTATIADHAAGPVALPPLTRIEHAHFRVSNLETAVAFYRDLVGMSVLSTDGKESVLSASAAGAPVLYLTESAYAEPRNPRSPGLFHMALLFPERRDLALAFRRLYELRWPFQGFADHGVSEALYLADPDGNGIELYIDRPRDAWPYRGGELQMVTEPLDVDSLLSEISDRDSENPGSRPGPSIGHMHLQVSDLQKAERFYHAILGFDITQRNFPGALFMSAGGYHHHIGVNTWNSLGGPSTTPTARGLLSFALQLNDARFTQVLRERMKGSEFWLRESAHGFVLRDGDNIQIEILNT
jgi:catechol 2,3-dioxygenase